VNNDTVVKLASLMMTKLDAKNLSDNRRRYAFEDITITLINEFDFEALTLHYQDELYGIYADFKLFKVNNNSIEVINDSKVIAEVEKHLERASQKLKALSKDNR
jgi:hypothetical protein